MTVSNAPTSFATHEEGSASSKQIEDAGADWQNMRQQLERFFEVQSAYPDPTDRFFGFIHIEQKEKVLVSRGFGDDQNIPTPGLNSRFRIASVTKQMTATAILLLVQDGKLKLDDRVIEYLPNLRGEHVAKLTVRQLLAHTSGVRMPPGAAEHEGPVSTQSLLDYVNQNAQIVFDSAPGAAFEYSNFGYTIAGAVIEKISGLRYEAFVEQRLLRPAGMRDSGFACTSDIPNCWRGHTVAPDGTLVAARNLDSILYRASGSLWSTTADLISWHRALQSDALLSRKSKAELYRVVQADYALGWMIRPCGKTKCVWHAGSGDGISTHYLRVPELDLVVVMWSYVETLQVDVLGDLLSQWIFEGARYDFLPMKTRPYVSERDRPALGRYTLSSADQKELEAARVPPEIRNTVASLELSEVSDALVMTLHGQSPVRLRPVIETSHHYFGPRMDMEIQFEDLTPSGSSQSQSQLKLRHGPIYLTYDRPERVH